MLQFPVEVKADIPKETRLLTSKGELLRSVLLYAVHFVRQTVSVVTKAG